MNSIDPQHKNHPGILISILLLAITICFTVFSLAPRLTKTNLLPEVYYSALLDAEQISSDEISTNLTAIVKDNPNIQWQGDRLKVSTYAKPKYFEVGSHQTTSREVWVTVVPELQNFCTNYAQTGQEISPRIEQLLGLAPSHQPAKSIVELWVDAKDLFRPTPDPEISDHEAELAFRPANNFLRVSPEYQDWFNSRLNEFESQLKEMNPDHPAVPWTRLGYTYDWGESTNHVGLSEFVLSKGAELEVESVSTVDNYCRGTEAVAQTKSVELAFDN
ncbi:MAG: hypothetical protein AAFQ14_04975 [Cyanobacteria bacterium J06621_12]